MGEFTFELNRLLVDTYRSILKMEERMLRAGQGIDLSINEMHVLEAVGAGTDGQRTVGDIARDLDITLPSVTIAINRLAAKGCVEKSRGADDRRQVHVSLTRQGRRINTAHTYFHRQMVRSITAGFTPQEQEVLMTGIVKLNEFFHQPALGGAIPADGADHEL